MRRFEGLGHVQQKILLALLRYGKSQARSLIRYTYPVVPDHGPYQIPDLDNRVRTALRSLCRRGLIEITGRRPLRYRLTYEGLSTAMRLKGVKGWK